jgi:hypothetical protein
MRRDWRTAPVVTIPVFVPSCPCGSTDYLHIRGEENGDNSSTELVVCARCSQPFKIVRERRFPNGEICDDDLA